MQIVQMGLSTSVQGCTYVLAGDRDATESERFSAQSVRPSVVSRAVPAEEDGTVGWKWLQGEMAGKLKQERMWQVIALIILQESDILCSYSGNYNQMFGKHFSGILEISES